MKRSRFSEEQIIGILREAEGQETVKTVCAKHNISEAAFYAWRLKYSGMEVSETRELRYSEDENVRLKRIVADLSVQNQILKGVNSKKSYAVQQSGKQYGRLLLKALVIQLEVDPRNCATG